MKYIRCEEPGTFSLGEKEVPTIETGQALVKIKRVGICGTDLHAFAGNQAFFSYPRVLGHELSGTVEDIQSTDSRVKKGDNVVIMPYDYCGHCVACRQGKFNCCANLKVLGVHVDGGMQEYYKLPAHLLLNAEGLSLDDMAIVEPLAIGAHAVQRASFLPGETALVIGCGPIGLGTIRMAQIAGAEVIAMDINPDRLEWCKKHLGLKYTINALDNPLEKLKDITHGDLAMAVFDATGNKHAIENGVKYMAPGGRYVFIGLYKDALSFMHPEIHAKEASLLCSRNATPEDMRHVIEVLRKGSFPTKAYITHKVPFTEMIGQFESWIKPETGVIKAMTVWE